MSIQVHHPISVISRQTNLGLSAVAGALAQSFQEWRERVRQRHALARLDDRLLRDMGLSRADVEQEVGKPFWQA